MKKFICLIGLVFMFNSSVAFADDKKTRYFNLKGMVVDLNDLNPSSEVELDGVVTDRSGFGFAMALGHKFSQNFRIEAQYARRHVNINTRSASRDHVEGAERNHESSGRILDLSPAEIKKRKKDGGIDGKITEGRYEYKRTQNAQHVHTETISTKGGKYKPYKKDAKGKYVYEEALDAGGNKIHVLMPEKDFKYDKHAVFADPSVFFNEDELTVQTAMANVYYDFPYKVYSPYIGAGVGAGYTNLGEDVNFAWQVMAGVSFPITDFVSANVGWTRLDSGTVEIRRGDHLVTTDINSHSFDFGITYLF